MQQRLEQMLRLALGFALLGAQPLELVDDAGELLLEGERRNGNLELGQLPHTDTTTRLPVNHPYGQEKRMGHI